MALCVCVYIASVAASAYRADYGSQAYSTYQQMDRQQTSVILDQLTGRLPGALLDRHFPAVF